MFLQMAKSTQVKYSMNKETSHRFLRSFRIALINVYLSHNMLLRLRMRKKIRFFECEHAHTSLSFDFIRLSAAKLPQCNEFFSYAFHLTLRDEIHAACRIPNFQKTQDFLRPNF